MKLDKWEKLLGVGGAPPGGDDGGRDDELPQDPIEALRIVWRDEYGSELPDCWARLARVALAEPLLPGPVLDGFPPETFEEADVSMAELFRTCPGFSAEAEPEEVDLPPIPAELLQPGDAGYTSSDTGEGPGAADAGPTTLQRPLDGPNEENPSPGAPESTRHPFQRRPQNL